MFKSVITAVALIATTTAASANGIWDQVVTGLTTAYDAVGVDFRSDEAWTSGHFATNEGGIAVANASFNAYTAVMRAGRIDTNSSWDGLSYSYENGFSVGEASFSQQQAAYDAGAIATYRDALRHDFLGHADNTLENLRLSNHVTGYSVVHVGTNGDAAAARSNGLLSAKIDTVIDLANAAQNGVRNNKDVRGTVQSLVSEATTVNNAISGLKNAFDAIEDL